MRKIIIIIFILSSAMSYSQVNWQEMMFDRNANFYDIQNDFYKYYKENVSNPKKLPKGRGIKQFKRWEYYWESRVDKDGNFPREGHVLEEINRYNNSQNITEDQRYASGSGTWEIVGPVNLPNNGTGQLNGNGRINCITFHPTDPNTIFIGAPSGGFWKSTDGGATWTDYLNGLVRLGVSSIVIDPSNPNTIYIATGDRDGGDVPGYGVWRSTDGGINWSQRNTGMGNRTINELIMDPSNPNNMLAASSNGRIYRTTNAGTNWTASASLGVNPKDIAYHPTNSNIVYASGTEFHKSTDGGVTWSQITNGVPGGAQRMAIAVSPNQPDWVYILAGGGSGLIGIYRSTNSGTAFSTRTTTPNILGYEVNGSGTASQAWYDLVIAADPTNADIIYTGGVNMWKSTNGGTTMTCASYWVGPNGSVDGVHADQHVLEFSPYTNDIYSGNDGGIYHSADAGTNWNDLSAGLAIAQIYKIGVSQNSDTVINGYQDNGTAISRGTTFTTEIGGDGMECIIDPTDDTYMYGALYYGNIRRSTNGGTTFSGNIAGGITENGGWVTPYKLDPNNANRMFAGFDNIWRNDVVRTGTAWTQISNFGGTSNIRDLAIAPSNSNIMYVSRYDNSFRRSNNALAGTPTWTNLTGNLPIGNEPADIEVDPSDPTHLFIAINNDIFESNDSGVNWTNFSGTLPNISINTITIDTSSPLDAMYIGMDVGIYYRDNTMTDWVSYSNGLPNLEVSELEIRHDNTNCQSRLYAATYGQGLWVSDLKDPGNIAPSACFEVNFTTGCVGNDFAFTDYTDYSPTSWSWTFTPSTVTFINATSANSQNPEVRFNNAGVYTVALTATNATGSDTNTKVNYITISNGTVASSFNEDFETEGLCGTASDCDATVCGLTGLWTNLTNNVDDEIDWRIDQGGTPSANTGPTVDYNPGTSAGNYAYLEASGGCTNNWATLESQCMIIDQVYDFILGYHMYGTDVGSLHIDILDGGVWQLDVVPAVSGNFGNTWNDLTVDLSPYVGNTIKIRIRGITGPGWSSDIAIDDLRFISTGCSTTVWNGSNWSNGTPSLSTAVEISGIYDTSIIGSFECCSLLVNPSGELIIEDSDFVAIQNGLTNNGGVTVKNNGSLVQVDDNGINIGNIDYERTVSMRKQDYVYWSSPLQEFNVDNVSPLTPSGFIYKWDPTFTNTNGGQGYWIDASSEIMIPGNGYIVRGPDNFNTTLQNYTATFSNGIPNNGAINASISRGNYTGADYNGTNSVNITRFDDNWNLIGNPYPSAINVIDFLNLNSGVIEGAVRLWTHGTLPSPGGSPFYGDFATNYTASDYITHNGSGTVTGPLGFNGFIAGGQGFMVLMNDGPTASDNVLFNNALRNKLYANNQFYRTSSSTIDKSRIWLNLSNEDDLADRTLIAYLEEATDLKDRLYDAVTTVDPNAHSIYTFIDDDKMTIQAFALPFSVDDLIPLGINIPSPGNYAISIHAVEGLFSSEQVFIEDLLLNSISNISEEPYTFFAETNEINDRFILRFNVATLSTDDVEFDSNTIIISGTNQMHIESKKEMIKEVVVYDILGRKLLSDTEIYNQNYAINAIEKSNSVLLIKITLSNNHVVYRKVLF
ncbi:T9SS sorting signal type C domain-containing protein [Oceanihabitans sp.]|nr:T9SS sorting signal type C domain-containing protein [Oceanihabitans sp.]